MSKEQVTHNIYSSWYETVKNTGKGCNLKPIKSLEAFTDAELAHLGWLIDEECVSRASRKSQ